MALLGSVLTAAAETPPVAVDPGPPLVGDVAGSVILEVELDGMGVVTSATIVRSSGIEALDIAALERARATRYAPALDDEGRPVGALVRQRVPIVPRPTSELPIGVEEVVVIGTAEQEVSEGVVTLEDIRYLPGGGGDVVRAVQNLPGISRPPFNLGQLLVRGTAPEDSAYYLDGVRIPIVFHFGGLSTVLNADTLQDVRFLPGGYGARYGRQIGGVVDLRTNDELPEHSRGYASVDLFQATGFAEVRAGRTAVTASARRSYIDTVAQPFLDDAVEETVRAPRYWDAQARVLHQASDRDVLDGLLLVSDDTFGLLDAEGEDVLVDLGITFLKGRLRWARRGAGPWRGEVALLGGPEVQRFEAAPDGLAFEQGVTGNLRAEVERRRGSDPLGVLLGTDTEVESSTWQFDIPSFGNADNGRALAVSTGLYGAAVAGLGRLEMESGARLDARWTDGPTTVASVDPRTILRAQASDRTRLEATVGAYSQPPTLRQVELDESTDLLPERSLQVSAGIGQALWGSWDFKATAYHSSLTRLVVGRQDAFEFFTTPPAPGPTDTGDWANDGTGRVDGVELQLRTRSARTIGWIAATISRSVRTDRPGQEPHVFAWDQPVNVVALASHRLGRGWRIGGRVRGATGTPYTRIDNRIYDLESRRWVPLFAEPYAVRLDPYFAIDARIDKEWTFERWRLSWYLDVTNVTNRKNQEMVLYSPDYVQERPITGLPIVPAFGLRGDF